MMGAVACQVVGGKKGTAKLTLPIHLRKEIEVMRERKRSRIMRSRSNTRPEQCGLKSCDLRCLCAGILIRRA